MLIICLICLNFGLEAEWLGAIQITVFAAFIIDSFLCEPVG